MNAKHILLSALTAFAALSLSASENNVKVVAHMGYWRAPGSAQNSIDAMVQAAKAGFDGTEFDVCMTSDSVVVVNHDGRFNGHNIEYTPSEIVCAQKLSNGENVPTLDAFFLEATKYPKLRLVCEMKVSDSRGHQLEMARRICELAKKHGLEDRIDYITFSRDGMYYLKQFAPEGTDIYYLNGDILPEQLKFAGIGGADYGVWIFQRYPQWIQQLHDLGMKVNIWTVDGEADMKWCIDHNADFVTTNYPERLVEILKTYK